MSNTERQTLALNTTLEKLGNVVVLHLNGSEISSGTLTATIPTGCRPSELIYSSAYIITDSSVHAYGFFQVSTSGTMAARGFYDSGTTVGNAFNGKVYGTICWCL